MDRVVPFLWANYLGLARPQLLLLCQPKPYLCESVLARRAFLPEYGSAHIIHTLTSLRLGFKDL